MRPHDDAPPPGPAREQPSASVEQSDAFYRSLVESLPQNFLRKDRSGRLTYANTLYCQTVGRRLDEILGKLDIEYLPPDMAAKYMADDQHVMTTGERLEMIEMHTLPGGNVIYVQVIKTPVRDQSGKVVGIQGIFWDVTERKVMEDELQHERELLQTLLDTCPDSIYFKDMESRYIKINRNLARNLGLSDPALAIGKRLVDFFDTPFSRDALADEERIVRIGDPLISKLQRDDTRGEIAWLMTTKLPLRDKAGKIVGTFGISRDVTELKRAETEIAEARDAALESARAKAEFLANMSHEIRTPLNAIVGMSNLLLDTQLDGEQRDFANTIQSSADLLLDIVNDILDFSKMEAGKLTIERVDFDLAQVMEETADLLAERAQSKGLELVAWMPPDIPRMLAGDPGRIRQILVNLVTNAVKFTEKGEVVIHAESLDETNGDITVRFRVRDTGIGIPRESHDRLFTAFTQADGSMTRRYGGTGLGLAISKQLVTLMGGDIGFESVAGQGSTFWFTVPLGRREGSIRLAGRAPASVEGLHVLIVDDNAVNREILQRQTATWRMRTTSVASGPAALEELRHARAAGDPYRLVLLDMQMPDMDGMTVAKAIKADAALNDTKIVVLTSLAHHPEERDFRRVGISAYLTKPVKQSRLYDILATVMEETERVGPAPVEPRPAPVPPQALRILMAEDNAVNQKVALRQLSRLGYAADAVASGTEVLAALEHMTYDVILMDCQMPEMDGYEATRRIRQAEAADLSKPRHYIIALTAHALDGDRAKCLAAGMDDYLSKPMRLEDLGKALDRRSV